MSHPLPPTLTNFKLPLEEQLQALVDWLRDFEDAEAVDAYLVTCLEVQLRTGCCKDAHEAGLKAVQGKSQILPKRLDGAEKIEAKPMGYRQIVEIALRAAGFHAESRRALLRPLFRSLLLWANYEREIAMGILQSLKLSEEEIAQGLHAVLSEIIHVEDRPGERLLTVIEAGLFLPRWIIALCRALPARRAAILILSKLDYAILPEPVACCAAAWIDDESEIAALRTMQQESQGLRHALLTLTLAAAPNAVSDDDLLRLLSNDELTAWVRERAADWLIFRNARAPILSEIADRLLARNPRHSFEEKLTLLRQNAAPQIVRESVVTPDVCLIPIEDQIASDPAVVRDVAVFLLIKTVQRFPAGDWRCAAEEAALGVLNAQGELMRIPLPLRLPSRGTGAAGAERVWALECLIDGMLLVSLRVPFSDERGWGTQNHVIAWDTEGTWQALTRTEGGFTKEPITDPIVDLELPAWGYGELVVWRAAQGRLMSMNDETPYHLEDSEPTQQVTARRAVADKAKRGWVALLRPSYTEKRVGLSLRRGRKTLRFLALEEVIAARAHLPGNEETAVLSGVMLGDGKVALAMRSYERSPLFRMHDSVALVRSP